METVATIIYWVKIVALVLVVVLTVVGAWRETGRCKLQTWREVVIVLLATVAFAGLVWITDPSFGWVWAVALIVAGVALGFVVGRRSERGTTTKGTPGIRRSPLGPWVWAVASILAATTLMFGSSYLFALAMLVMAFAVGAVTGQTAGEMSGAKPAAETPDTPS